MTDRHIRERRRRFAEEQKQAFLETLKQPKPTAQAQDDMAPREDHDTLSSDLDEGLSAEDQP